MASNEPPFCTDEEILQELKNLGYNDIPADAFLMMKKDLSELVLKDQSISRTSFKSQDRRSTFRDRKYPSQTQNLNQANSFLPGKSPTFIVDAKTKANASLDYLYIPSDISVKENSFCKYSNSLKNLNQAHSHQKLSEEDLSEGSDLSSDTLKVDDSLSDSDVHIGDTTSFSKYKERLKNFKAGRPSKSLGLNLVDNEEFSNSSSVSIEGNKIKRKVLRHKNGKPVITEEFLEIPSIFNTSYPETENSDVTSKSISSDESSFKSNSSSGSASIPSPDSSETPRSTVSMSSTRSVQSRTSNQRKKKSDPVAMYNYYKKFWNDFKPPGEKTHDKLRWAVRDRMLDYTL